jgi:hypothetical protein
MGWDFSAVDRRLKDSPNFFYDCRCGHGPRLNDLYAWHFAETYYPGDRRVLSIYGYPLVVSVRCAGCEVTGKGADVRFSAGIVEVGWRRLKESNPRQVGIAEMLNRRQE